MNLGTHIITAPNRRWIFVGNVPRVLGYEVPATKSDVLGCRAYRNEDGVLVTTWVPSFETETEAREHAAKHGVELSN